LLQHQHPRRPLKKQKKKQNRNEENQPKQEQPFFEDFGDGQKLIHPTIALMIKFIKK
jgi:hypothetical protein